MKIRRLLALLALFATLPARAQGPTDASLHDFEPDGEYEFQVDGKAVPGAEIARANHLPAYLIISKSLAAPVLLLHHYLTHGPPVSERVLAEIVDEVALPLLCAQSLPPTPGAASTAS